MAEYRWRSTNQVISIFRWVLKVEATILRLSNRSMFYLLVEQSVLLHVLIGSCRNVVLWDPLHVDLFRLNLGEQGHFSDTIDWILKIWTYINFSLGPIPSIVPRTSCDWTHDGESNGDGINVKPVQSRNEIGGDAEWADLNSFLSTLLGSRRRNMLRVASVRSEVGKCQAVLRGC